jgi:defect-in-organelle-trafficking protein DotD
MLVFLRCAALAALVALTGCATAPRPVAAAADPAADRLADAATRVQGSLQSLAEAEAYTRQGQRPGAPRLVRQIPGLEGVVTMPWSGPIEPAVARLAAEAGWQVKVAGRAPTLPIIVRLDGAPRSIGDALYSMGVQAGTRADVVVDPHSKVIAIEYSNAAL